MTEERPVIHVSTPAVILTVVALLGTLVALTTLNPGVAIVLVIFAFIFGGELLEYVTTELADEPPDRLDDEAATADDPLARLRNRYADGELSHAEFERRLEALVETETVADVERYLESDPETEQSATDRDLERSLE
ncbi:SHOCT domain-containing protein [Halopiger djelfimassiliensis]|uniref:SHOCT domain-containing protein n=1 Tax=Halopiger djelfimassiliensis TaxID=1293047 RepID=UPI000677B9E0|nr:SHOCT domain-containing protein [Halopiger djelfimassiliensis]